MLEIFYPHDFQNHNRSHEEWSLHHWLNGKNKEGYLPRYYKHCAANIYQRAISYGLRPEFAWELANM